MKGVYSPAWYSLRPPRPRGSLYPNLYPEPAVGGHTAVPAASGWVKATFVSTGQTPMEGFQKFSQVNELGTWPGNPSFSGPHPTILRTIFTTHGLSRGLRWTITLVYWALTLCQVVHQGMNTGHFIKPSHDPVKTCDRSMVGTGEGRDKVPNGAID